MPDQDDETRAQTKAIVQDYLAQLSAKNWTAFGALWAESGILEFPYAPEGAQKRYVGRDTIVAYMSGTTDRIAVDGVSEVVFHPMLDPAAIVVELQIKGRALSTGKPYDQRYVTFFRIQNGEIVHYREYWSPLITMEAFDGYDAYMRDFYPERTRSA